MLCVRFIFKGLISVDRLTAVKRHTATSANACFEKVWKGNQEMRPFGRCLQNKRWISRIQPEVFSMFRRNKIQNADMLMSRWPESNRHVPSCHGLDPSAESRAGAFQRRVSIGHHWFKAHMCAVVNPLLTPFGSRHVCQVLKSESGRRGGW